jgi:hypothetical protein
MIGDPAATEKIPMNNAVTQNPDGTIRAEAFGHVITTNPDGSGQLKTATGQILTFEKDGSANATGAAYSAVQIADLSKVTKYVVTTASTGTWHEIELFGGGSCKIEFDSSGSFRAMSGAALQTTITNDNRLILIGSAEKQ